MKSPSDDVLQYIRSGCCSIYVLFSLLGIITFNFIALALQPLQPSAVVDMASQLAKRDFLLPEAVILESSKRLVKFGPEQHDLLTTTTDLGRRQWVDQQQQLAPQVSMLHIQCNTSFASHRRPTETNIQHSTPRAQHCHP
jgi:hypothetical protein